MQLPCVIIRNIIFLSGFLLNLVCLRLTFKSFFKTIYYFWILNFWIEYSWYRKLLICLILLSLFLTSSFFLFLLLTVPTSVVIWVYSVLQYCWIFSFLVAQSGMSDLAHSWSGCFKVRRRVEGQGGIIRVFSIVPLSFKPLNPKPKSWT